MAAGGTGVLDLTPEAEIPSKLIGGFTCVRLIIRVRLEAALIDTTLFGALGVLATARGTLMDLPNPIVDLVDWYWHDSFDLTTSNNDIPVQIPTNDVRDIRTARKLRGEDRSLIFIIANASGSGGAFSFEVNARLLLKDS